MMRATLLLAATAAAVAQGAEPPKNVLFVAVDDMRPSIGAFNFSMAHTPNMDQLAATGLVFKRAYVQYAFCAPSRNSFMSGRRPDTTRVWNFMDHFREEGVGAEWLSMCEQRTCSLRQLMQSCTGA
jgi:iduronate 2-sulfatase